MSGKISRKRKVDVTKLPEAQIDILIDQIGEKVRGIFDNACTEANTVLDIYGLQVKIQTFIKPKDN